jgi:hypothetical protein
MLIASLLCGGGYFLVRYFYFGNDHFLYNKILMEATPHFTRAMVQTLLEEFPEPIRCIPGKTSLTRVDLRGIRGEFLKNPILEDVEVRRIMPDSLAFVFTERRPIAYLYGTHKKIVGLVDRNAVLFPYTGDDTVPPDLPFITQLKEAPTLPMGEKADSYLLRNAIELIMEVGTRRMPDGAGYQIRVVQVNERYEQFECILKPIPGNKVFAKDITVIIPVHPDRMRSGLSKLDAILVRKLKDKETLSYADVTLEHNIPTRR